MPRRRISAHDRPLEVDSSVASGKASARVPPRGFAVLLSQWHGRVDMIAIAIGSYVVHPLRVLMVRNIGMLPVCGWHFSIQFATVTADGGQARRTGRMACCRPCATRLRATSPCAREAWPRKSRSSMGYLPSLQFDLLTARSALCSARRLRPLHTLQALPSFVTSVRRFRASVGGQEARRANHRSHRAVVPVVPLPPSPLPSQSLAALRTSPLQS